MDRWLRTVLWREIEQPGTHWCELLQREDGWRIRGLALSVDAGMPLQARYDIGLDDGWKTRDVQIAVRSGAGSAERTVHLTVDAEQRWRILREPASDMAATTAEAEALAGLVDIDLSLTPATNTLPIRRLSPAVGEAVDVTAVWVRFPELTIAPLPQRYTRLAERAYRYESNGGAFVAQIDVDDQGLVTSYEGLWQRIAETSV